MNEVTILKCDELADVTNQLGEAYSSWKRAEREKNELRDAFFCLIDQQLKNEVPSQIIAEFPTEDEEEALRQAQRRYVRHRIISTRPIEGGYQVILEEDPEYRPFSYVNKTSGRVFQRIISEGSPVLDDEALKEENPELWEAITEEIITRELKPLTDLTPEQIEELEPYISMPKPQARLAAPRVAKNEELDE